jgi:hypothetical protein
MWELAINRPDNPDLGATIQLATVVPINEIASPPDPTLTGGFRTPNPPAVMIPPETVVPQGPPAPRYQRDLGGTAPIPDEVPPALEVPRPSDGSPWATNPEPGEEE